MSNGWFVHGHYLLSSTFDPNTADTSQYTKGGGMQVDLGYLFPVGQSFHLGLQLTHRAFEYKALTTAGVDDTTNAYKINTVSPKVRFTFFF